MRSGDFRADDDDDNNGRQTYKPIALPLVHARGVNIIWFQMVCVLVPGSPMPAMRPKGHMH